MLNFESFFKDNIGLYIEKSGIKPDFLDFNVLEYYLRSQIKTLNLESLIELKQNLDRDCLKISYIDKNFKAENFLYPKIKAESSRVKSPRKDPIMMRQFTEFMSSSESSGLSEKE